MMKKLGSILGLALLIALAVTPTSLAYSYYHRTTPNINYWNGETRVGAYTSTWGYGQGMYNYVSPPVALTRNGASYNIMNVRNTVYPEYPVTHFANIYRPYYGYPFGSYGNPVWERYRWGVWNGA